MDEFELILAALAIFFLPFSYSYWLARKIKSVYLRLLPLYVSLIPIGFAVVTMMQPAGGFWICAEWWRYFASSSRCLLSWGWAQAHAAALS